METFEETSRITHVSATMFPSLPRALEQGEAYNTSVDSIIPIMFHAKTCQSYTYCMQHTVCVTLTCMQLAVASFVLRKYASMSDILSLGWLPVVERRDFHLAKLVFKAIHSSDWPSYLKLDEYEPSRPLRSSSSRRLVVPRVSGTFQGEATRVFNDLPEDIRNRVLPKLFRSFQRLSNEQN
jgi:hypothetical protein